MNNSILDEGKPGHFLEILLIKCKLIGHIIQRQETLQRLMLHHKRDQQKTKWLDTTTNDATISLQKLKEVVTDS